MAEASALGTPPALNEESGTEGVAVNIPINAQSNTNESTANEQANAAPFTPPSVDESSKAPFTPPSVDVTATDDAETTPDSNPIPMPPDLDETDNSASADDTTDPNNILNAITANQPTAAETPSTDQPSLEPSATAPSEQTKSTAEAVDAAVAKLNGSDDNPATTEAPATPPAIKPDHDEAITTSAPAKLVKSADTAKIATKPAPKVTDDPRIKEHIAKVTAPVETMIANAQSMGNKELVSLLQKQKDELSQKAREDFAHNDKLKSERLSRAAQTIAIILQTRSAGQRVGEQILYEYDPEASAQAGVTEFANAELALDAARAVYQLVGAKEPNDLAESEPDENGNKIATATRDTDIGVQLKEWVNMDANGAILQMRISTAEI